MIGAEFSDHDFETLSDWLRARKTALWSSFTKIFVSTRAIDKMVRC
jgi:hypothetical protein